MNNARNNLPKVIGIIQIVYAFLLILYGFFGLLYLLLLAVKWEIRYITLVAPIAYVSILLCVGIILIILAIMLVVRMFKKTERDKNKTGIFIASIVLNGAVILSTIAVLLYTRALSFLLFGCLMFILPPSALIVLTSISLRQKHSENYLATT